MINNYSFKMEYLFELLNQKLVLLENSDSTPKKIYNHATFNYNKNC
jgi:hypothetical protein